MPAPLLHPQHLPPDPIDTDEIAQRLGLNDHEVRRMMRALERRGVVFSRIDQATMTKVYYPVDGFDIPAPMIVI